MWSVASADGTKARQQEANGGSDLCDPADPSPFLIACHESILNKSEATAHALAPIAGRDYADSAINCSGSHCSRFVLLKSPIFCAAIIQISPGFTAKCILRHWILGMINEGPLQRFEPLAGGLIKPIYADYSFGNIPNTIHYLLTGEHVGPLLPKDCFGGEYPRPEKVVLFFVDSFGWQFWREHQDRFRTTRRIIERGVLTPISALFPSTTAASVATLNFGVLPAVHAMYEWNIYVPAYGEVIQSLPFCPLGPRVVDACLTKGYDPYNLMTVRQTVHQRLAKHGVRSIQFTHRKHMTAAFNLIAASGAEVVGHGTLAEALVQLKDHLAQVSGKAWLNFYWDSIDGIAHVHGPGTSYHAAEIASFWQTFDHVFHDVNAPDTIYLFVADHGHVDARESIYINQRIPTLSEWLRVSPTGNPIYPNGSPRDLFIHVKQDRIEEALALLRHHLADIALVLAVEAALEEQLFGPHPIGAELRRRLGDIVVLPYTGYFVSWFERGLMENRARGHHGGLTAAELISALGVTDTL